jgi:hypothetical protein
VQSADRSTKAHAAPWIEHLGRFERPPGEADAVCGAHEWRVFARGAQFVRRATRPFRAKTRDGDRGALARLLSPPWLKFCVRALESDGP